MTAVAGSGPTNAARPRGANLRLLSRALFAVVLAALAAVVVRLRGSSQSAVGTTRTMLTAPDKVN